MAVNCVAQMKERKRISLLQLSVAGSHVTGTAGSVDFGEADSQKMINKLTTTILEKNCFTYPLQIESEKLRILILI